MAGAAAQTQGCSGPSRDVGTCQAGGSGDKEENCGILEGKESLRELLGMGWYWVGVCRSRYPELRVFLGLCELLKGKNMSPVGMHREDCCLVSEILCEKHPLMLKSLDCSLVCLSSRKSCCCLPDEGSRGQGEPRG